MEYIACTRMSRPLRKQPAEVVAASVGAQQATVDDAELDRLRQQRPDGLTAHEIVELFRARGVRMTEATFRKYVQLGLLPRSRRVGRKGRHRGSLGLYPVEAVRRVDLIKRALANRTTI